MKNTYHTPIHDDVLLKLDEITNIAEKSLNLQSEHLENILNNESFSADEAKQASREIVKMTNAVKNLSLVKSNFKDGIENEVMARDSFDKANFDNHINIANKNYKSCEEAFADAINNMANNNFFKNVVAEEKDEFWNDVLKVNMGLDFSAQTVNGLSSVMWDNENSKIHSIKDATSEYYFILSNRFNQEYDALKTGLRKAINIAYSSVEDRVSKGANKVLNQAKIGAGIVFSTGNTVIGKVDDEIYKTINQIKTGTDKFLAAKDVVGKGILHANIKFDQAIDNRIVSPSIEIFNFIVETTKSYADKFKNIVEETLEVVKDKYHTINNAISETYETSLNSRIKARKELEKNYDVIPRPAFKKQ